MAFDSATEIARSAAPKGDKTVAKARCAGRPSAEGWVTGGWAELQRTNADLDTPSSVGLGRHASTWRSCRSRRGFMLRALLEETKQELEPTIVAYTNRYMRSLPCLALRFCAQKTCLRSTTTCKKTTTQKGCRLASRNDATCAIRKLVVFNSAKAGPKFPIPHGLCSLFTHVTWIQF